MRQLLFINFLTISAFKAVLALPPDNIAYVYAGEEFHPNLDIYQKNGQDQPHITLFGFELKEGDLGGMNDAEQFRAFLRKSKWLKQLRRWGLERGGWKDRTRWQIFRMPYTGINTKSSTAFSKNAGIIVSYVR